MSDAMRRIFSWPRPAVLMAITLSLAACGGGGAGNPTAVPTIEHATPTPASSPSVSPTATTAQGQSPPSTAIAGTTATASTSLTVIGKNISFDRTSLTASPGKVVVTFDNQDPQTVHNFHLFRGDSPSGESLGMTELKQGPNRQTLSLDLAPGTYFFHCDVHPDQMKGILTVTG